MQKLKFLSKIKIFVENQKFGQKFLNNQYLAQKTNNSAKIKKKPQK